MTHEFKVLQMKYQAALRSLATASDTVFALDAELTVTKARLEQAEKQLALATQTQPDSEESIDTQDGA